MNSRKEIDWEARLNPSVRVRVKLRRDRPVKAEAEALDGREFDVVPQWRIDANDSRYPGEYSLTDARREFGSGDTIWDVSGKAVTWIASGDVEPVE